MFTQLPEKNVITKLEKLMKTYKYLQEYPRKKKGDKYYSVLDSFSNKLFDIKCKDHARLKDQEKKWRVKQTKTDIEFYNNQTLVPQVRILSFLKSFLP